MDNDQRVARILSGIVFPQDVNESREEERLWLIFRWRCPSCLAGQDGYFLKQNSRGEEEKMPESAPVRCTICSKKFNLRLDLERMEEAKYRLREEWARIQEESVRDPDRFREFVL